MKTKTTIRCLVSLDEAIDAVIRLVESSRAGELTHNQACILEELAREIECRLSEEK